MISLARGAGGFTEAQIEDKEQAVFTETQISDAIGRLYPKGRFEKNENGFWVDVEPMEEKRVRAVEKLREELAEIKPRYERPRGLYAKATKGFTGDEYAFVYRSGMAGSRDGSTVSGLVVPTESTEPTPEKTPDQPQARGDMLKEALSRQSQGK